MLNRTLKTTSATLNRLDLGTRLFAQAADTNMGPKFLRIRHAHPQAVVEIARAGIHPAMLYPPSGGERMAEFPGSTLTLRTWPCPSPDRPPVVVVVDDDRSRRSGVQARSIRAASARTGGLATGKG